MFFVKLPFGLLLDKIKYVGLMAGTVKAGVLYSQSQMSKKKKEQVHSENKAREHFARVRARH